jgi:hypothetical protein
MAIGPTAAAGPATVQGRGSADEAVGEPAEERNAFALLPRRFGPVRAASGPGDSFFKIANINPRHPVLDGIVEEISFKSTQVRRFVSMEGGGPESAGTPILELDGGPLLMENRVGAGTVLVATTGATPEWSNLPVQPYFLPLLHQLVYYTGRSAAEQASTEVGMAYRLRITEAEEPVPVHFYPPARPAAEGEEPAEPEPHTVRSEVRGGRNQAVFGGTVRPGIYRAEVELGPERRRLRYFAVNMPSGESNLERLPAEEAGRRLGAEKLAIIRDPERLRQVVERAREGLPLWDFLLVLAVAVAVGETYISNVMLKQS